MCNNSTQESRIIICLPNCINITGNMTIDFAKDIANKNCPDLGETLLIILIDEFNEEHRISCLERRHGEWCKKALEYHVY